VVLIELTPHRTIVQFDVRVAEEAKWRRDSHELLLFLRNLGK